MYQLPGEITFREATVLGRTCKAIRKSNYWCTMFKKEMALWVV